MSKTADKINSLDLTRMTINSQLNLSRYCWKEENLKHNLKKISLQNEENKLKIRDYRNLIAKQRKQIAYQLNCLTEQIMHKINQFEEYQITKQDFCDDYEAEKMIVSMLNKYEIKEKDTKILKNNQKKLINIFTNYTIYLKNITDIAVDSQNSTQKHQNHLQTAIKEKMNLINQKKEENSHLQQQSAKIMRKIRQVETIRNSIIITVPELQKDIKCLVDKLNDKKKKLSKVKEVIHWIIDKSERQSVHQKICKRNQKLQLIKSQNNALEIQLCQLQIQFKKSEMKG